MKAAGWARVALPVLLFGGCGSSRPGYPYSWNDLQLITAYTAKTACTCLFVMELSEDECRAYAQQSPAVATWRVSASTKTVDSSAALFWGARARYRDARHGCTLE